jgi:tetratricopeptide (TPR) repeat protein
VGDTSLRLSGWKAIAAHFGRDRSTVLRWAAAEDFPVRRVPGKKSASVYAFADELDDWLETRHAANGAKAAEDPPPVEPLRPARWRAIIAAVGVLIVGGVATITLVARPPSPPVSPLAATAMPRDPVLASLYAEGRDDWATRTPQGLRKAIAELGAVARRDPVFAPGHAGLAEAFLLSCEFDSMPTPIAFAKADAEANAALRVDPDSADGNRVLGFIDYWGRHDLRAARSHFLRSLRAEPASAETHHWYGNVLMDNGEGAAALKELLTARTLDPGSASVQTDYAWAQWQNGAGAEAVIALRAVEAGSPSLPSPPYFLAMIALATGDVADYLDQARRWTALQGDGLLAARLAAQTAAFRTGGPRAVLDLIAAAPPLPNAHAHDGTLLGAGAAALAGDRARLLDLLTRAEARGEHWKPLRWQRTLFAGWRNDPEVSALLEHLFAPAAGAESLRSLA